MAAPAKGSVSVNYALDLRGQEDQSLISWSICDDAAGANPRVVAVSRGNQPLRSLALTPGYVGKFAQGSGIQPKHPISEAGPCRHRHRREAHRRLGRCVGHRFAGFS